VNPGGAPAQDLPRPEVSPGASGARRAAVAAVLALTTSSCSKVPIYNVDAGFVLADVSWFAEEETLFAFYQVTAEQGLGEPSVIEITYTTDDERVDWTPLSDLPAVHTHVPVDCGATSLCGSTSLHVEKEPRDVKLRLRYHRDGALALDADTVFNVVGPGNPWSNRSYLVYGVLDEANQRVQWRGRHRFPTLRNDQATDLGLRRELVIADQAYGADVSASADNPYGYGVDCPTTFASAGVSDVETVERAVFDTEDLPVAASDAATVCAQATVTDATGTFTTGAIARKNPEVRAAFPELRSPIRDATPLPFFLEPCDRTISREHAEMQRQRLGVGDLDPICTDDWDTPGFRDELVTAFTDAVEAARPAGRDMVLVIGLEQDQEGVAAVVQDALAEVVPEERLQPSPRLAGAFVFDSDTDGLTVPELEPSTLWCPSTPVDETDPPSAANLTCAIAPDNPDVELGPFSFGTLPILPPRDQYLDFIDTYSVAQAGDVTSLSLRTPEFATTADHVALGDYGVVTFPNDEVISAETADAFSYCVTDEPYVFVFRSDVMQSPTFARRLVRECARGTLSREICDTAGLGLLPIQFLPEWHDHFGESNYDLGLGWDFPFLVHMEYETYAAGALTAFGLSVPFGVAQDGESYLGTSMWTTDTFSLEEALTQCTRFCDHPTFDSAGVYQVSAPFRSTYADSCYLPDYPALGDSGFPLDP
jgi:hypothetical protein